MNAFASKEFLYVKTEARFTCEANHILRSIIEPYGMLEMHIIIMFKFPFYYWLLNHAELNAGIRNLMMTAE